RPGQKPENHVTPQQSWLAAAQRLGSGQAGVEPAAKRGARRGSGCSAGWCAGAELPRFSSSCFGRGRSLSASALSEGDAANAGETAARQSAGGEEQIRHSELELLRLRRCLDSARQEFAELLGDFPSPSCLLSFLTRRLEQADPLDPWLSRLLLNEFRIAQQQHNDPIFLHILVVLVLESNTAELLRLY
uniref:ARHGB n=1 Tax=Macrostomum lignano TaxID=282301 RepID=A0A1I8FD91_9PLAT